jgi:alkylation response protein AidB-like acyl-CoA dehydrogenase
MNLSMNDEQEAVRDSVRACLEREATPERVRACEPLGFDELLWGTLADIGVTSMVAPPELGGTGSGLLDVALVAEELGRFVAPVPLLEHWAALRLLMRAEAKSHVASLVESRAAATIAPRPARSGRFELVPGGAVCQTVLGLEENRLVAATGEPGTALANLGSTPVAHRDAAGAEGLAEGAHAQELFVRALDDLRCLMAAALAGVARRALEMAVEYVKEREQFGVAIGSFQTVSHKLADIATEVDGAELLAREAAWSSDEGESRASVLAPMAFGFASEVAQHAVDACLHFHGGYGFTLEYDIQLYFRRAKGWPLLLATPDAEMQLLADRLVGPVGEAR